MFFSIRKVFLNLKITLLALGAGVTLLLMQLLLISQSSERLEELKKQHFLINKIIVADRSEPQMAAILVNGAVAEMELSLKRSGEALLFRSDEEQETLHRSLEISSKAFRDIAVRWINSASETTDTEYERMMNSRLAYQADIDRMLDYQITIINGSIKTATLSAVFLFFLGLFAFVFYYRRLSQIYHDVHRAHAVDTEKGEKLVYSHEFDYILKQLYRRPPSEMTAPGLINSITGLPNDKGLINAFNAKKLERAGNAIFVALFEVDHYDTLLKAYSKDDFNGLMKKLADMISLYEKPLDIIAHFDNDRFAFVMARTTKKAALDDAEHIVKAVKEGGFMTSKGTIHLSLSAGFLSKTPIKSLDQTLEEGSKLIAVAKENGGGRVAQQREGAEPY